MPAPRRFDHDEARRRYQAGETQAALAREYGVTASALSQLIARADPERHAQVKRRKLEWMRKHYRVPCANGCGQFVWRHNTVSGLCSACSGLSRRTDKHGTEGIYRRCRCDDCRAAASAARRQRRQANPDAENAYQRAYRARKKAKAAA